MRIYLQTIPTPDQPPRFYHIHLEPDLFEGWMLTKEWGAQGSSGRVQMKHYDNIQEAESALENIRDAQIKRGYRIVFVEGQSNPENP